MPIAKTVVPDSQTFTKADLAQALTDRIGLPLVVSRKIVANCFDLISETLEQGRGVKLENFGNFVLQDKNARPGRNPKTGETIPITARRVVAFHPSPKFRAAVNKGNFGQP